MSITTTVAASVEKKDALIDHDTPRFLVRGILAGAYLTLATGFAGVAGNVAESIAPGHGLGALVFAFLFGLGLYAILLLNAELATGNMMYTGFAAAARQSTWLRGSRVVVLATLTNLVGAMIVAALIGYSAKLNGFDSDHLLATLTTGKLDKNALQVFIEATGANFVVNMAILAWLLLKDATAKFLAVVLIIAIFVGLGLEHVIANFAIFGIAGFAGLINGAMPAGFTAGAVGINWLFTFLGNFVGGALLGVIYAWLNQGNELYRD